MEPIRIDYSKSFSYLRQNEIDQLKERITLCHNMLHNKNGQGSDYLGWVDLPDRYDREEFATIQATAQKIRNESEVFLVVGIGGSYLGARAAIEMLNHSFYNELPREKRNGPKIYYVGHNLSATYIKHLLEIIAGQDISINVISKSGTTTEPALAFGILKEYMENKYGRTEASQRIYATTDKSKGVLRELYLQEGYETFVVPDDIGGRYSVLTPVGLLPMAVAGINIDEVMEGARSAAGDLRVDNLKCNHCYQYAAIRNIFYDRGKTTEIMVSYEPRLSYFGEWFKQLFGESEGKDGKGIFPASVNFTTDLHSMGQYIQDGRRNIFETVLNVEKSPEDIIIKRSEEDMGLNYLAGKTISLVNNKALEGTISAHIDGGVPNLVINIPEISPYYFGYLVYFFEKACAISGYLLGVNPFDQPGVEAYKRNMFKLLGRE
jgi:glucose-6-phosphate isomerase